MLADISSIMAQKDANIIQAEIKTTMDNNSVSLFTVEVEDFNHLQDIMGAIKKVRDVLIVERI
jgi:GTP pyrophosphokinase